MDFYDNIRYAIKLLFSKEKELYSFYRKLLGFYPDNSAIYRQAFLHRSEINNIANERLEYLGDAVINAVIADMLYSNFNHYREGELSKIRSKIVQRTTLNELADKIGITEKVRNFRKSPTHNCNVGGNAFEALIGAIYSDKGYNVCRKYIIKIINENLDIEAIIENHPDYKSQLLEWGQKHRKNIEFNLTNTTYDENKNPIFHTTVIIDDNEYGHGTGYSKKESQQIAAKETYRQLNEPTRNVRISESSSQI